MENLALTQLRKFVAAGDWKYRETGPNASEPAGLACLALCAHGFHPEALPIAKWLSKIQATDGSVGVTESEQKPAWPTSLALLSWLAVETDLTSNFSAQRQHAIDWILETKGKRLPRRRQIGHDTTIDGWSWADNTHSWLEPTCLFVLALKAAGLSDHVRSQDGLAMIVDRLHDTGGCNYGNTIVLGQATLPHVQPTGLAMLAVADQNIQDPRIELSLDYLADSLNTSTATASLCFALLGLTANGRRPSNAGELVDGALVRDQLHQTVSCYKLALLTLAALPQGGWLPSVKEKISI